MKREEDLALEDVPEHLRDAVEGSLKLKRLIETEGDGSATKRRKTKEDAEEEDELKRECDPKKTQLLRRLRLETDSAARYCVEAAGLPEVEELLRSSWNPNRSAKKTPSELLRSSWNPNR